MTAGNLPTPEILDASAHLKGMRGVRILEGWRQYEAPCGWVLKCRLCVESENTELVPAQTDWYVKIANIYPDGNIEFDPARERSITATFQHQFYNGPGAGQLPWRTGRICAKGALFSLRRHVYADEPFDAHERLRWNVERAREWLLDASSGTLVQKGDPFELPDYGARASHVTLAFSESPGSLVVWRKRCGEHGVALFGQLREPKNTLAALVFNDRENKPIREIPWNSRLKRSILKVHVVPWVLLPDVPFLSPWQAPMSWGELRRFAEDHNIDWSRLLNNLTWPLSWDHNQFMLLGFGVPEVVGGPTRQLHWQALLFPGVKTESKRDPCTGRSLLSETDADPEGEQLYSLQWQRSQNWHARQILNRGMFADRVCNARILLIGAGALGSMMAEIFVRGGATSLVLLDGEELEIGNLARHTLTLGDIGTRKVHGLAERLRSISPHVAISEIAQHFERLEPRDVEAITNADIVLDATGNDDVLRAVERFHWDSSPLFSSVSVGLQARRLYVFTARRRRLPAAFFLRHMRKWLERDGEEYDGGPLPIAGGIGCWHPTFPARVDDMWLLAATATKHLEKKLQSDRPGATLAVFEQQWKDGSYCGTSLVREEHDNG